MPELENTIGSRGYQRPPIEERRSSAHRSGNSEGSGAVRKLNEEE